MSDELRVIIKHGLHRARVAARISQAELCHRLETECGTFTDQSTLSKLERGTRAVSPALLAALAQVLGVPVADLLDGRTDAQIRQGAPVLPAPIDPDALVADALPAPASEDATPAAEPKPKPATKPKPKARPKPAAKRKPSSAPVSSPEEDAPVSPAGASDHDLPSSVSDALAGVEPVSGDVPPSSPGAAEPVAVVPPATVTSPLVDEPAPAPDPFSAVGDGTDAVVVLFDQQTEVLRVEIPAGRQVTFVPAGPALTVQVGGVCA